MCNHDFYIRLIKMLIYVCPLICIIIIYVFIFHKSIIITEKFLEFIHIPKNAGTTIENIANDAGIKWGRFKPEHRNYIDDEKCTYWHQPPKKFKNDNFYKNDKTFCVLRHPMKKIISEYTYRNKNNPSMNDPKKMNDWIREHLNEMTVTGQTMNCHFVPQYEYVYDDEGNTTCDYRLNFDNLTEDFNKLMQIENVDLRLEDTVKHNTSDFKMNITDLDEDNVRRIYEIYRKDFELLNIV